MGAWLYGMTMHMYTRNTHQVNSSFMKPLNQHVITKRHCKCNSVSVTTSVDIVKLRCVICKASHS